MENPLTTHSTRVGMANILNQKMSELKSGSLSNADEEEDQSFGFSGDEEEDEDENNNNNNNSSSSDEDEVDGGDDSDGNEDSDRDVDVDVDVDGGKENKNQVINPYKNEEEVEKRLQRLEAEGELEEVKELSTIKKVMIGIIPVFGVYYLVDHDIRLAEYRSKAKQKELLEKSKMKRMQNMKKRKKSNVEGFNKTKANKKQKFILNEFVETEETYLRNLKTVIQKFYDPLKDNEKILSKDKVTKYFGQFKILLPINELFLDNLKKASDDTSKLTKLMLEFAQTFKLYSDYIRKYKSIISSINKEKQENEKYKNFEEKVCESLKGERIKELQGYMITPVQRVPRYRMFLDSLLEQVSTDDDTYKQLEKAAEMIDGVNSMINEQSKSAKSQESMVEIANKLNIPNLVQPARKLIRTEENCYCHFRNKKTLCDLYLFSDLFICHLKHQSKLKKNIRFQKIVYVLKPSTIVGRVMNVNARVFKKKILYLEDRWWISEKGVKLVIETDNSFEWIDELLDAVENLEMSKKKIDNEQSKIKKTYYLFTKKSKRIENDVFQDTLHIKWK